MANTRILIAEDEVIIAKDIEATLQDLGYVVVDKAKTGEEVIEKARKLSPDLILMDIRLKGQMRGIEAAQEIRKQMDVPIIYLTAYTDKKILEEAKVSEPFGYIVKPFAEHDLYTVIEISLYRHSMERKLAESEKRFRDLYENAPDGYVTVDPSGWVLSANAAFREMVGHEEGDIVQKSIERVIHETSREDLSSVLKRIREGRPFSNARLNFVDVRGRLVPTLVNSNLSGNAKTNGASRWVIRDMSDVARLEREKQNLRERVIRLEKRIPLTDNEKKVFLGVVSRPELNDVELSKLLRMKRSTITAIKNRLKRDRYYESCRIPDYPSLGCELIIVVSAVLNPVRQDAADPQTVFRELSSIPESVYVVGTCRNLLCIKISKNFTEFKKQMDEIIARHKKNGVISSIEVQYFPYETSTVHNFFGFSRHLSMLFDLPIPSHDAKTQAARGRLFTRREKQIFYALVLHSDLNDSEIAAKTRLPRPSISQVRRRLLEEGHLREANIPRPLRLQSELLVQYTIQLHSASGRDSAKLRSMLERLPSTYLLLSNPSEACSLHLYNDYSSFQEEYNKLITSHNGMQDALRATIFPLTQLREEQLQFAPLLGKALGVHPEVTPQDERISRIHEPGQPSSTVAE